MGATILHYAQALDPRLQQITELADRGFCIYIYREQAPSPKAEGRGGRCPDSGERKWHIHVAVLEGSSAEK